MIPLHDDLGFPRFLTVTFLLVVGNVAVFAYQLSLGPQGPAMMATYGLVPARITALGSGESWAVLTLLTSMFVHGGILHLVGNMLYLFIFGPAVEARFGSLRYLAFYLIAGMVAGLVLVAIQPASLTPMVGASGAIAAVLGAYLVLFPKARIKTVLPIFILVEFISLPALLYLMLWFAIQLIAGLYSGHAAGAGVAWWVHVGGFLIGVASAPLLADRKPMTRRAVAV
jgi:membrane associated rhomboid family serine protease